MPEITVSGSVGGKTLSFSSGKLAGLADGAVVTRLDETEMLATATANKTVREGIDFFPLTVDIEERMYAVGRIPGSFFRREGRPSEDATLTARLIDRPLRPSFRSDFRCETHVVVTTLAVDGHEPLRRHRPQRRLGRPDHLRDSFRRTARWGPPGTEEGRMDRLSHL